MTAPAVDYKGVELQHHAPSGSKLDSHRVIVVTSGLVVGGAEKMLVNVVNGLNPTRVQTTIVALSAGNPLASELKLGQLGFEVIPRGWRFDLTPAIRIRRLLKKHDIQTILCYGMFDFFFARLATLGGKERRIVISIHSTELASKVWHWQHCTYARMLKGDSSSSRCATPRRITGRVPTESPDRGS